MEGAGTCYRRQEGAAVSEELDERHLVEHAARNLTIASGSICSASRALFQRERASGLVGAPAYFTAAFLFEVLPMRVVPPLFFALSTYW